LIVAEFSENAKDLQLKNKDKFLAALHSRKTVFEPSIAILLLEEEIKSIPETVSEPMIGKIKLQWWREVVQEILQNKPPRPHPILLALKDFNVNYSLLLEAIDYYDKVLDGWQPKSFTEIEEFVEKTNNNFFKMIYALHEKEYDSNLATAYGLVNIAKNLAKNSKSHENFATEPQKMLEMLCNKADSLLPAQNSAFRIICKYYLTKFAKAAYNPEKISISARNPRLIAKLMFSKVDII